MSLFKPLIHKSIFKKHFKMIYTNIVHLLKCSKVMSRIKYIWFYVVRVGQWFNLLELAWGKSKTIKDKKQNIPYLMF